MQALDTLNGKVSLLLKKYAALQAENKRLRDTIAGQIKTEEALNKRLASLEQDMVSVRLDSGAAGDGQEKENMRRQLDMLIAEIDGILKTLND